MHLLLILGIVCAVFVAIFCSLMALTTEPNLRQTNSLYADLPFEDLMNVLDRVQPAETPLYTMCRREYELGNTEFAWEVDNWPNPNGAQGPGDGYAVQSTETRDVTSARRKMGNVGQAFRRVFGAGWIANQVPNLPGAGKGKLLADGAADAMVLLKQDIECAFASFDQLAVMDVGGASGSVMSGLRMLVDPANAYTAPSGFAFGKPTDLQTAPTGAVVTGTMTTVFTLTSVRNVSKALRQSVKRNRDYIFLCGLDLRSQVTGLVDPQQVGSTATSLAPSQIRMFKQEIADSELGISIDVVRTDWGRWLIMPSDFIGKTLNDNTNTLTQVRANRVFNSTPTKGYLIPREKVFKRWGVPFQPDTLQNDGGSTNRQIRCYVTLGVGNPQGFGFYDLT